MYTLYIIEQNTFDLLIVQPCMWHFDKIDYAWYATGTPTEKGNKLLQLFLNRNFISLSRD
jgi:hypothetical protein